MVDKRIVTARLELIPAWGGLIRADLTRRQRLQAHPAEPGGATGELARLLDAVVPEAWPPPLLGEVLEAFARQLEGDPTLVGWSLYYWVRQAAARDGRVLVGSGGYKGRPNDTGTVEIGYSMLDAWQRQGYATEAVDGLVRRAFAHPAVRRVIAETYPNLIGSVRVLEKNGFVLIGGGHEPGIIRFERLRGPRD